MAPRLRIPSVSVARASLRPRCPSQAAWSLSGGHRARGIAQSYIRKMDEGDARWKARAEKIASGEIPHLWDILDERGYIKDVVGTPDRIKEIMRVKRVGAYVGIDPTADSLHVGHLLPMMPVFWMWFHGHKAALLIGGATARIGDPTGRLQSREVLTNAEIGKNITKLHYQLSRIWSNVIALQSKYGYEDDWAAKRHLLNNSMWLQKLTMYDFTKRLARHMRIGPMLGRDNVKRKMTEGDGMSLGEFMYPLFQAWDWFHIYSKLGIQMQIGGSDQFGNIVAGAESFKLLRKTEELPDKKDEDTWQNEPIGFTVPLVTDSAGSKLGKTAGNAVWLDEYKTSAFELYGYFMRRSDDEVEKFLKLLTFMPVTKIQELMVEHKADPSKRVAQHALAFDVLSLVYGSQTALEEAKQHEFRFGNGMPTIVRDPTEESGIITPNNAPRSDIQLPRSVMELSPAKLLHAVGLATSAADGQRLVKAQGAYVAGAPGQKRGIVPGSLTWTPMKMWFPEETLKFLIDDSLLILRKGKHNVRIVELIDEEEWKSSGKTYPGEPFTGKVRQMKSALLEKIRADAEATGEDLTGRSVTKLLKTKLAEAAEDDPLTVANNKDIWFPDKKGMQERAQERKRLMQDRKREHGRGKW